MVSEYLKANASQSWGFREEVRRRYYYGLGGTTKLDKLIYSSVSKPWNAQLSIQVYADFKKIVKHRFDYPKLWFRGSIERRWTFSFSIYHLVITRTASTKSSELAEIVHAVVLREGQGPYCQVVYYLPTLEHFPKMKLLTRNFQQRPTELFRFNVMSRLSQTPEFCQYITTLKQRHFYNNKNSNAWFETILFGVWQISLGNYSMHYVEEYRFSNRDQRISHIKFCKEFRRNELPYFTTPPTANLGMTHANAEAFGFITAINPKSDLKLW